MQLTCLCTPAACLTNMYSVGSSPQFDSVRSSTEGPATCCSHNALNFYIFCSFMPMAGLYIVQVGAARRAIQAFLSPQVGKVYTAFFKQQLIAQVSPGTAGQVILEYCTALARLVAALPSAQAPADMLVQRAPMWPCTQACLLPSGSDIVTPLPQESAAATADTTPASAAATAAARAAAATATGATAKPVELAPTADSVTALPPTSPDQAVLTRAQAFLRCAYLVQPSEGLIWAVLKNSSKPAKEQQAALELLTVVYCSNCSIITENADHAAYCCRFHFTTFVDAYNKGDAGLCCQHLTALQALAKHKVSFTMPVWCLVRSSYASSVLTSYILRLASLDFGSSQ